jgi:hypothetical protein
MDSSLIANPLKDPPCPECGCMMWLARIEARKPGYEERIFECPRCVEVFSSIHSR